MVVWGCLPYCPRLAVLSFPDPEVCELSRWCFFFFLVVLSPFILSRPFQCGAGVSLWVQSRLAGRLARKEVPRRHSWLWDEGSDECFIDVHSSPLAVCWLCFVYRILAAIVVETHGLVMFCFHIRFSSSPKVVSLSPWVHHPDQPNVTQGQGFNSTYWQVCIAKRWKVFHPRRGTLCSSLCPWPIGFS